MILEARSRNCFSTRYVLKLDGRPIGEYTGRWFSEGLSVRLTNHRRLLLDKSSWLRSRFVLREAETGQPLAEADRTGFFTSRWQLTLSGGPAEMVSAGFFRTGMVVRRDGAAAGRVENVGWCENGWTVHGNEGLDVCDALLIGLIYHTIVRRRQQSS